jgi:ketosteroid isomerase-like protein
MRRLSAVGLDWRAVREEDMPNMRSFCAAILVICAGAITSVTAYAASPEEEVKAAYASWDQAFSKGDAKAIAAFYSDDAIFLPPSHDVIRGPAGVEKFFVGLFNMGVTGHKLELIEEHGGGNLLFGAAKWSANGKDASGKDQPWGGVATHIFERQNNGSLKIKLHTFN